MAGIEMIPSARRLITSLRDMGYDFSQAVADIVDNSIEAKATIVAIDIEFDGDDSWLRITDNGKGMTPEELREAMRYGADRDYEEDDLGKFGLGLKTASMSQCQRLSVASRWNPDRADISAYAWDLKHIQNTNRWEVLPADTDRHLLREPLKGSPGTVVLWQRLDRILGYKLPYGEFARKRLLVICREVEAHLAMVFHKFLNGEVTRKRLKILLNGNEIKPWDPFCRSEPKTKTLQTVHFSVEQNGTTGDVAFEPYVLPHQDEFSSPEAWSAATGPQGWNQQQGFYIYRANRMIQSGGWSKLRKPDEHTKLARVAVTFPPKLDEAFKINVAKMRVQMPASIREDLNKALAPCLKIAQEAYRRRQPASTPGSPRPSASTKVTSRGAYTRSFSTEIIQGSLGHDPETLMSFDGWAKATLAVTRADEREVVETVLERLSDTRDWHGEGQ